MADGTVWQGVDQARHASVDRLPVLDRGPPQTGTVGESRDVQEQIGRAAERRVDGHRVAHGGIGKDVARGQAALPKLH